MNSIKDCIKNNINGIFTKTELQNDEYFNETDGLIYCSKCSTPRQVRVKILGRVTTPFVMCKCRREEHEKEQKLLKKHEFLEHVARLKATGLQDKALIEYRFENDKGYNQEMTKAHEYINNWEQVKKLSMGFILWGDTGTGKSFFASCIANALIEKGIPVLMTIFREY